MTNLMKCNKSDEVWNGANSVFQLTFSRRRRLWCWRLLTINCERTPSSHSRVLSNAISTLVLTRVTSHEYPKRRACSQAQAFWWKAQSGCKCKLSLVFASSRIMTINVLVYKLAFKKNQEKYTSSLSNREANTRKLVHRSSTFQPQFCFKNIQKNVYPRIEPGLTYRAISLTTTLRRWLHATLKIFTIKL